MNKIVDVIIPTYNGSRFICDAIQSVINQSIYVSNIFVIDDASTDNIEKVISSFKDKVIFLKHNNNKGCYAARNTGIKAGKAAFIAFIDDDDFWNSRKLEEQLNKLEYHQESALVYSSVTDCDDMLKIIKDRNIREFNSEYIFEKLYINGFTIPLSTAVIRREIISEIGLFNESMIKSGDYEFWLRLSMHYPVSSINKPLCLRRNNPNSITNTASLDKELFYVFQALDLCGIEAKRAKINLPITVAERKQLYLYRRCRESILWKKRDSIKFFWNKLEESGGMNRKNRFSLNFLRALMNFKNALN